MKINQLKIDSLDAEVLLCHVLSCDRAYLFAHSEYELTKAQHDKFQGLMRQRAAGKPVAYIIGEKEFWSITFKVNVNVLIPRPETEILVETVLEKISDNAIVADIGTGSGAIAVALASEKPSWKIIATDLSDQALAVAKQNAKMHSIEFYCGDACDALPKIQFDAIVSNPPYIKQDDEHLQGAIRFEPQLALVATNNGLAVLDKIIKQSKSYLKDNGFIFLEHGYDQAEAVRQLLVDNAYVNIETINDLAGLPRVSLAQLSRRQ